VSLFFLTGCSSRYFASTKPAPGTEILISKGNAAFARLDYQKAWEAYRQAQAMGVQDAVIFYRLAVLADLVKAPGKENRDSQRKQAHRLLENVYQKGADRPLIYFYLAQIRGPRSDSKIRKEGIWTVKFRGLREDSPDVPLLGFSRESGKCFSPFAKIGLE
jgi:hypothetical protein